MHKLYRSLKHFLFPSKPLPLQAITFVNLRGRRVCTRINGQWHVIEPLEAILAHEGYTELLEQSGLTKGAYKLKVYKRERSAEKNPAKFNPVKYD